MGDMLGIGLVYRGFDEGLGWVLKGGCVEFDDSWKSSVSGFIV